MAEATGIRVAVLDDFQAVAEGLADWASLGAEVTFFADHLADPDRLVERLAPFEVVVAMRERTPFPRSLLERLPRLRLLVTTGGRNRSIDVTAAEALGVVVCGTRSVGAGHPELAWALVLAVARHVPEEDARIRGGGWQRTVGTVLRGKTLGILGLGDAGQAVARMGLAFGMRPIAWSPHLTAERAEPHGVEAVDRETLFRASDVLTIHLGLGETTRGLIGEAELRSMRDDAILVNTSRGPIVDESALLRALHEGWIAGAGLDVFDVEPLPADHPLRSAPRTVLTPHLGYVNVENYRVLYADAVEDIRAFLAGSPIRRLDPSAGA